MLTLDDFPDFFDALNNDPETTDASRRKPFPWQCALMKAIHENKKWPNVLDLPTGSGKTSVLDVAVFHMALCAAERWAPRRIFFVVDRRVVVDAAFGHAYRMAERLDNAKGGILRRVADALKKYGGDVSLRAAILRGGMYRDDSWAASPVQPVVCVSTVDQVGSRLLFRGYGLSPSMRPIHAGLVGCDSLIILDEAHLSVPFIRTLDSIAHIQNRGALENFPVQRPLQFVRMTATPREEEGLRIFRLSNKDKSHPVLRTRLEASKLAQLEKVKTALVSQNMSANERRQVEWENLNAVAAAAVNFAWDFCGLPGSSTPAKKKKKASEPESPQAKVIGVVVNRVATAREILRRLRAMQDELKSEREIDLDQKNPELPFDVILLTGRTRPFDRDELLYREKIPGTQGAGGWLRFMKAGRSVVEDTLGKPFFVVATQTIEAGADLDFDALVTEVASLDALRQRFGRLNRLGVRKVARAVIFARSQVSKEVDDPVYGSAMAATWDQLTRWSDKNDVVDFGIEAMDERLASLDVSIRESLIPQPESTPELTLDYVKALCQTNPAPIPEPEVSLFLHGGDSEGSRPADVQIVWRADLPIALKEERKDWITDTVNLIPPSSPESLSVSIAEVRRWLASLDARSQPAAPCGEELADVEGALMLPEDTPRSQRRVLRWSGPEAKTTGLILPQEIRPGDTLVVPAEWGGCDKFGWNPQSREPVQDLAERANLQARHRPALRLSPLLLRHWIFGARDESQPLSLPESLGQWFAPDDTGTLPRPNAAEVLDSLNAWLQERHDGPSPIPWLAAIIGHWASRSKKSFACVQAFRDRFGNVGLLLLAKARWDWEEVKRVLTFATFHDADLATTEDDTSWMIGNQLSLDEHTEHVEDNVAAFVNSLATPGTLAPLHLVLEAAAKYHDEGKRDDRFQIWMHGGNEVEAAKTDTILAKSGMVGRVAIERARQRSGWPKGNRHEGISVRMVEALLKADPRVLAESVDTDLLLYLIGTHHGFGRPCFPVVRDDDPGTVSLNGSKEFVSSDHRLHHLANGWTDLFWRVTRRYGAWNLAFLEALLRLADHAASAGEQDSKKEDQEENSK